MTPIRIFIGTEPSQWRADRVLEYSIRENSEADVDITMMRAGEGDFDWPNSANPTAFTMFRFCIPEMCDFNGFAIYLDCDMLVLDNIGELLWFAKHGKWVQHAHREGDCISVIDCAAVKTLHWPSIDELKKGKLRKWDVRMRLESIVSRTIPTAWNSMDKFKHNETRLIHFTDLSTQPWLDRDPPYDRPPHRDAAAVHLWNAWEKASELELCKS